jgi:hypothetical protein
VRSWSQNLDKIAIGDSDGYLTLVSIDDFLQQMDSDELELYHFRLPKLSNNSSKRFEMQLLEKNLSNLIV